jgi:hypothetical protein
MRLLLFTKKPGAIIAAGGGNRHKEGKGKREKGKGKRRVWVVRCREA